MSSIQHNATNRKPNSAPLGTQAKTIALADILVDRTYHSRATLNEDMVKRYATIYRSEIFEEVKETRMPPLEVALINDAYVLFDGFLRYYAMKSVDIETTKVFIHEGKSFAELPYLSSKRNLTHGLPMHSRDIRNILFKSYIKSKSNRDGKRLKSYREIAEDFYRVKSHNTFRNWMKKDFPSIFKAMQKDDVEPELEFQPIDHEQVNLQNATHQLENAHNHFRALKTDQAKVELWQTLYEIVESIESDLPKDMTKEEDFSGVKFGLKYTEVEGGDF